MENATTWAPSQPYGIANVEKQPCNKQMLCKGRNFLTTPAQRGEYNDAGDSQAVVPFTTEVSCGDTDMDWHGPGAVLHMEWVSEAGPTWE